MDPFADPLYHIHLYQASLRGVPPRDYLDFLKYVTAQSETDLSQLFLPKAEPWYKPLFEVGPLCPTPLAIANVPWYEMLDAVVVHATGHWGAVSPEQWLANDRAVANGDRICSAHRSFRGLKFWVITEADRSRTTIGMADDWHFLGGLP